MVCYLISLLIGQKIKKYIFQTSITLPIYFKTMSVSWMKVIIYQHPHHRFSTSLQWHSKKTVFFSWAKSISWRTEGGTRQATHLQLFWVVINHLINILAGVEAVRITAFSFLVGNRPYLKHYWMVSMKKNKHFLFFSEDDFVGLTWMFF